MSFAAVSRRVGALFAVLISTMATKVFGSDAAPLQFDMTPGVTEVSRDVYQLHQIAFWVCVAIGVVVFGLMFYSIIKHRKSNNPKPADFHESILVEVLWTIVPFIILIVLAVPATRTLLNMRDPSGPDLTIKVTGYQWKWHYEYLGEDVSFFSNLATPRDVFQNYDGDTYKHPEYLLDVDNELVLPTDRKVRFIITSNDVIHSWWVPAFAVKKDAIPGFINEAWTRIEETGTYRGQCTELCGVDHGFMPVVVEAKTPEAYDAWLAETKEKQAAAARAAKLASMKDYTMEELMAEGEKVYLAKCAACHQVGGEGMPPAFPALKGSAIALDDDKNPHIDIILHGQAGTAMQAFKDQLTDVEIAAVVTYERNAWGNNKGDMAQPAEVAARR